MQKKKVNVIGAGLAGCECAYQLAKRGVPVRLYEMKPGKKSPAHVSDLFAELVCSNSLRSDRICNAAGLLKEEMRLLESLIMQAADATSVAAGGALAVDREKFSAYITQAIREHGLIELLSEEVTDFSKFKEEMVIVASGPLTSQALSEAIKELTGQERLHFFDAAAPIVSASSIDMDSAFFASRYGRGSDYINCPMTREEYEEFYQALVTADCAELREFEHDGVFEGCMPVETMASRGHDTLLFGPLKPKGLTDPKTGREPFAVVQLRRENDVGSMYNIVGFQTHLKFPEQRRVFGLIPALKDAEYLRFGIMHRNTFLNSPRLLDRYYRLEKNPLIRFVGQITGVEGYVESTSSGLLGGIFAACEYLGKPLPDFDDETASGALCRYISGAVTGNFQPMNINFGIMRPLGQRIRNKEEKKTRIAERALEKLKTTIHHFGL
ncbi:methylenetetrahydrofolate--tRNA-(uracil(54)-C(5))-methyltransferase (FADH(2)-oxidizing) TrmFO [Christensenella tenuis]|jgi:methylenetetrahydrofolate--tRNA-(uracil-5-)-methyltransferase|uniref:Methylenetetrahydrofolate--tRNA-(uracil-5-)-methyltransferase TrmFO n=1 Tax=Christensenella tenuis TaxID=2763033 RepID=A0ABR7ED80_9FIRM|nr:methylenetetrahydrofolate--tRNA-(uracil(54)-C(5))-methyltransferase (FADH(2)-oxidizing) TrmFO [Christensenella tenuis]MBC5647128.1 methylenetetrahydrofolate--tRNA-(uracil(54)-C(5))-methyltransferase (FADH(2)-oxidizing) TrmFO [Christensenella tenuis]